MLKSWEFLLQMLCDMKKLAANLARSVCIARLIGKEGKFGEELGLSNDWAYNIISAGWKLW